MTSVDTIRQWLYNPDEGSTHMVVVVDTFSYDDYPVYTANVKETIMKYNGRDMQNILEVYDLSIDLEDQLAERRAYHV